MNDTTVCLTSNATTDFKVITAVSYVLSLDNLLAAEATSASTSSASSDSITSVVVALLFTITIGNSGKGAESCVATASQVMINIAPVASVGLWLVCLILANHVVACDVGSLALTVLLVWVANKSVTISYRDIRHSTIEPLEVSFASLHWFFIHLLAEQNHDCI